MKVKNLLIPFVVSSLFLVSCGDKKSDEEKNDPVTSQDEIKDSDTTSGTENQEKEEQDTSVTIPTAEEVYNKAIVNQKEYDGDSSIIMDYFEDERMTIYDSDNNSLSDEEINKLLKVNATNDNYYDKEKDVITYNKQDNIVVEGSYAYNKEENKLTKKPSFESYFKKDEKCYKVTKEDSDKYYSLITDDAFEVYSQPNLINYLGVIDNSFDFTSLNNIKESLYLLALNNIPNINPNKIEYSEEYNEGKYEIKYELDLPFLADDYDLMSDVNFVASLEFDENSILAIKFLAEFFVLNEETKINNEYYTIGSKVKYQEVLNYEDKLDEEVYLTKDQITDIKDVPQDVFLTKGVVNLNYNDTIHSTMSVENIEDDYVLPSKFNFEHIDVKLYEDKAKTKEILLKDIKKTSLNQYLYVDLIPQEGYAVIIEKIFTKYFGYQYRNEYYVKEIKVEENSKYTIKESWTEKQAELPGRNLIFTTILLDGEPVIDKTEIDLEAGKVYFFDYQITNHNYDTSY